MFDYHMHTTVSFDGHHSPEQMLAAAQKAGLKEICFTDHTDYQKGEHALDMVFSMDEYAKAYDHLSCPGLKIRRGMEFGLLRDNKELFQARLKERDFDFVLGSIHFVDDNDVYYEEYWNGKTVAQAERVFLEETLACVQVHEDFDVLAHLTFLAKAPANPVKRPIPFQDHREIFDEILRILADKGKGLEMNTSGIDRCGGFLPTADFFRRFKELGGQIVTVGSDAHTYDRVGQYCSDACQILGDIFGYVCTFEGRKPIFHKL